LNFVPLASFGKGVVRAQAPVADEYLSPKVGGLRKCPTFLSTRAADLLLPCEVALQFFS
jgi:hypothetical protein